MNSTSTTHTGNLELDAPKVFRLLSQRVTEDELLILCAKYTHQFSTSGHSENPIEREQGVSFNPKTARLIEVLIKELDESDSEVFASCMELSEIGPSEIRDLLKSEDSSVGSERIVLAYLVDLTRHLHMTSYNQSQREDFINFLSDHLPNLPKYKQNMRLVEMINSSLQQMKRRFSR